MAMMVSADKVVNLDSSKTYLESVSWEDAGKYYRRSDEAEDGKQNEGTALVRHESINNTLGAAYSSYLYFNSKENVFRNDSEQYTRFLEMMKLYAVAPYMGWKIEAKVFDFSEPCVADAGRGITTQMALLCNVLRQDRMEELKKLPCASKDGKVQWYATLNGEPFAMYIPDLGFFVPRAGELPDAEPCEELFEKYEEAKCRYIALLSGLVDRLPKNSLVQKNMLFLLQREVTAYKTGMVSIKEFEGEPCANVNSDFVKHIAIVEGIGEADASQLAGLALGMPGKVKEANSPFVKELIGISVIGDDDEVLGVDNAETLAPGVLIAPPFKEGYKTWKVTRFGDENDPSFIEVVATKENDETKYRCIYSRNGGWRYGTIPYVVSHQHAVPAGMLRQYNYSIVPNEPEEWQGHEKIKLKLVLPGQSNDMPELYENVGKRKWELHQSENRIEYIQIVDDRGRCYGSFVSQEKAIEPANGKVNVAMDAGGTSTTILIDNGTLGEIKEPEYIDTIQPITPTRKSDFTDFLMIAAENFPTNGGKRESMLQEFKVTQGRKDPGMIRASRIWEPEKDVFAETVKRYYQNGDTLYTGINVSVDMKSALLADDADDSAHIDRLVAYQANALRDILVSLFVQGYSFRKDGMGNIKILISYPYNGEDDKATRRFRRIAKEVIKVLNNELSPENQIQPTDWTMHYEASATTAYQKVHQSNVMNNSQNLVTDMGATTNDITVSKATKFMTGSMPFAGDQINMRSAMNALRYDPDRSLLNSFSATGQEQARQLSALNDSIKESLRKMESNAGGQDVMENIGLKMALNKAFKNYSFRIDLVRNRGQKAYQKAIEQRLLCTVPFYANMIANALKRGVFRPSTQIHFILSGNGSRVFDNTREEFEDLFVSRLTKTVHHMTGDKSFTGNIDFIKNVDAKKQSVAEGMLRLEEDRRNDNNMEIVKSPMEKDVPMYYLGLVYEEGTKQFESAAAMIQKKVITKGAGNANRAKLIDKLKEMAYDKLFERYSVDDFNEHYNLFGELSSEDEADRDISNWDTALCRNFADPDIFERVMGVVKDKYKNMILASRGFEKYIITSAIINELTDDTMKETLNRSSGRHA